MGIRWRRFLVAAGILRADDKSPSPWFIGIAGSVAVVMGIVGVLFGTASERWVFVVLIVGGAIEVRYARRIYRANHDGG
ncbi:MAG: hypothetical protein QOG21_1808 [Actinomycetota bacterium]|nr:hypothetical protein [Actinomycetota bacterium]